MWVLESDDFDDLDGDMFEKLIIFELVLIWESWFKIFLGKIRLDLILVEEVFFVLWVVFVFWELFIFLEWFILVFARSVFLFREFLGRFGFFLVVWVEIILGGLLGFFFLKVGFFGGRFGFFLLLEIFVFFWFGGRFILRFFIGLFFLWNSYILNVFLRIFLLFFLCFVYLRFFGCGGLFFFWILFGYCVSFFCSEGFGINGIENELFFFEIVLLIWIGILFVVNNVLFLWSRRNSVFLGIRLTFFFFGDGEWEEDVLLLL